MLHSTERESLSHEKEHIMPRTAGKFSIIDHGREIVFTRVGETYKTVDSPSGLKSRNVIVWQAADGDYVRTIYVLPRTTRAEVVEQYFCSPSQGTQGIVY